MKYINQAKIEKLLKASGGLTENNLDKILEKARTLKGLSLQDAARLLSVEEPARLKKIFTAATWVKNAIYGKRVVLFVPLYISNVCANGCLYCAFRSDNRLLKRKALSLNEIKAEVACLLKRGHKRILVVAAEPAKSTNKNIDYYVDAVKAIYSVKVGPHQIRRANINCAPLSVAEFKKLKSAGIGTYQLFQETYHEETYKKLHPYGPKKDFNNRIAAIDRAFRAGIDDVGIGVLYGLYDYKFDTLGMLMHIRHLEKVFRVGPHTISVPRLEPALGSEYSLHSPYRLSDQEFGKVVAVLRLAVPYTGIILTTRESPAMRNQLFNLGVSQVSAESRTSPGGYAASPDNEADGSQFSLSDRRSLDEVVGVLLEQGLIPSFCAACYRKERTGEAFMRLAKPGTIKNKCNMNALITLREYLEDFASAKVRDAGYRLISAKQSRLSRQERRQLSGFFRDIEQGARDKYV
jgi:2-iminoacetate synthase